MTTAQKLLAVARAEIGRREGRAPNGAWNNDIEYNDWYVRRNGAAFTRGPWCAVFVSWVAHKAGLLGDVIPEHAYTPAGFAWFRKRGLVVQRPRPGDIMYVHYPSMGRIAHVGIVEAVDGDHIITIEGNTNAGQSRQGNGVYRLRRPITSRLRFCRPKYTPTPTAAPAPAPATWDGHSFPGRAAFTLGSKHPAVTVLGERLVKHGYHRHYKQGPGIPMGMADVKNCADFQRAQGWSGSDADGYPGPTTWALLMASPESAPKPTPPKVTRYRVTTSGKRLNGRSGPGAKYRIVTSVPNGKTLEITKTGNGWAMDASKRWYSLAYLKKV